MKLLDTEVSAKSVYLLERIVSCRIESVHIIPVEGGVFLNKSMMLGELRETVLIAIASVVKGLRRVIGVGSGIMKS
jgi:hypothetical protein